jgi:predicted metal-dependent hydrolase
MSGPLEARRPVLSFSGDDDPAWYAGRVHKTLLLNAWWMIFPELERLMIDAVRNATPARDPRTRSFFVQEAVHADVHQQGLAVLRRHGVPVDRVVGRMRFITTGILKPAAALLLRLAGPPAVLAIFASAEHWTAGVAVGEIDTFDEEHRDSDIARMFLWHASEELEHRAVVYDLFRAHHGHIGWRYFGFAAATFVFFLMTFIALCTLLPTGPRLFSQPPVGFARSYMRDLGASLADHCALLVFGLDFLRPGYHPDDLPMAEAHRQRALQLSGFPTAEP